MEEFFTAHGLLALFLLSFLASTVIPLGSEWLLVTLLVEGHSPAMPVAVATLGNTLGAVTTYLIGLYGGPFLINRVLRISNEAQDRAEGLYTRYGSWSLLFSWLPIIGDPLCLVGGLLKVRLGRFSALVLSGKFVRYVFVSLVALKIVGN